MRNKIIIIVVFAFIFVISGIDVSAQRSNKSKRRTTQKVQNIRINLTEKGYRPTNFRLKRGIPARLTFVRQIEDECGKEIVIPAYQIRRELPLNKPVTVSFTPRKAGTFGFACGMNMLKGKIIVQ
ncbi:MAG TPA: cupredoxin domain-containing protein [Pyrinomonadaceae bacterium]|jgi:Cu+-exporting ATPase